MLQIFCVSAKKKTIFATCNQQKQHKDRENKRECNAKRSKEINCDASTMMVFNENYTSLNYSRAKDVNAIRSVGWLGCVCARIFFPYFLFVFGGWLAWPHHVCFYPLLKFSVYLLLSAVLLLLMLHAFMAANFSLLRISCGGCCCFSKFMHNIAYGVLFSIWSFHFSYENAVPFLPCTQWGLSLSLTHELTAGLHCHYARSLSMHVSIIIIINAQNGIPYFIIFFRLSPFI